MFRKKKNSHTSWLMNELKNHPGEILVCEQYIATMLPNDQVFIAFGDYRGIGTEEANEILVRRLTQLKAQQN